MPAVGIGLDIGVADGDQLRRGQYLQQQTHAVVLEAGSLCQPLDLAHAQPTAAQLGRGVDPEFVEQQAHLAQQVKGRSGGGRVGLGLGSRCRLDGRWLQAVGLLAAKQLRHEPGQQHGLVVDALQQAGCQQSLHRTVRWGAGSGVAGAADGRSGDEGPQQFHAALVGTLQRGARFVVGIGGVLADHLPDHPGEAEPGLTRQIQQLVLAPHQRQLAQPVQRGAYLQLRGPPVDLSEHIRDRDARDIGTRHQQRIQHCQRQKVQVVGGRAHRLA
ncbi:Uncharacterised protein [Mycobacteroides abscessus subsp. massiliense]|nr:Uncharacterised protein [Mycobacteroides abscessus subsp. massiliense]